MRTLRTRVLFALASASLAGAAAVGCTSSDGSSSSSGGAGDPDASNDSAAPSGDAGGPAGTLKRGILSVQQSINSGGPPLTYASLANANFFAQPAGPNNTCTGTTTGACSVLVCKKVATPEGGALDAGDTSFSAGPITVTTPLGVTLDLKLNPDNSYALVLGSDHLWDTGGTVTATAAGGVVPAFTQTVTPPSEAKLTTFGGGPVSFPRSADLTVAWTNGGLGNVQVLLSTLALGAGGSTAVQCSFPSAPGTATIPASVLGQLQRADGATVLGDFAFTPQTDATFTAGEWVVRLSALGTPFSTNHMTTTD
jgi:hypothetical protein